MKSIGIIPARYASSRFPGKPLAYIGNRTMLERVYRRALQADLLDDVWVATDDQRIAQHVRSFHGQVMLTSSAHQSGTDRCAEAAKQFSGANVLVNIQGDEPFIDPRQIDAVIRPFQDEAAGDIVTLAKRMDEAEDPFDPNKVKVVFDTKGRAMYFSRSPVPHLRRLAPEQWPGSGLFYKHLGLYAYRRPVLLAVTQLPVSKYEEAESLEQLRWLEAGYAIRVEVTETDTLGVDTLEDLKKAESFLAKHEK